MAEGIVKRILDPKHTLAILGKYPLNCGDSASDKLTAKQVVDGTGTPILDQSSSGKQRDFLHMAKADRVSYFDLRPQRHEGVLSYVGLHLEHQQASAEVKSGKKAKTLRPIFYLPYKQNSITRMKLSPPPGYTGSEVKFFATAAINACSVYVEGPGATPKVTHANAQEHEPIGGGDSWAEKIRKTQAKSADMDSRYAKVSKQQSTLVERSDYIVSGDTALQNARSRFAAMVGVPVDNVYADTYNPLGAVIGVKQADGTWQFYVQKNVCFGYKPSKGGYTSAYKVMEVKKLWPGGTGSFRNFP